MLNSDYHPHIDFRKEGDGARRALEVAYSRWETMSVRGSYALVHDFGPNVGFSHWFIFFFLISMIEEVAQGMGINHH